MAITAWIREVGVVSPRSCFKMVQNGWLQSWMYFWISGDEITKMTIVRWVKNQLLDKTGGSMGK